VVWFNQAHLFHISNLEHAVRESLERVFAPEDLPRNAFLGDGSPIPESALDNIRTAYRVTSVEFPWQARDLLLLDNMLTAHGRNPFTGQRRVAVAMAQPYDPGISE
jgi:alpha-ketoglutarate-dependent taurine dioxygenase